MITRRIACIDSRGIGVLTEEKLAAPPPGQVQVEVRASLISPGTELGRVGALRQAKEPAPQEGKPRPFGYANAGVVTQVGEGVSDVHPGDRVACMGGGYALHADAVHVPVNLTAPVPEGVDFESAAFAHLAATALHAMRRVAPLFGENGMVVECEEQSRVCFSASPVLAGDGNSCRADFTSANEESCVRFARACAYTVLGFSYC